MAMAAPGQGPPAVDLIAFGSVFLEVVFGHIPALPGPGEEIFAEEFGISCGGAVTVAVSASRAGAKAGLCTSLGDDLGSRFVEDHCRRKGVDLSSSQRFPSRSAGTTVVLNFDGDRAFITHPPRHADIGHWRDVLRSQRPAWCYVHPGPGVSELLREARSLGTRIALDVNLEEIVGDPATVLSCASLADIFLPNEEELLRLAGTRTLAAALDTAGSWSACVVVKRGAMGAMVVRQTDVTGVTEGVRRVRVRDRTGAGDAFAGAMIGAICRGASVTWAVASANAAGSAAVTRLGGLGELRADGFTQAARSFTRPLDRPQAGVPGTERGSRGKQRGPG